MDDLFGGDYGKAVEAHKNIQGLQTQTAQKLTTAEATIADLQSKLNKAAEQPTPAPSQPTNEVGNGGSLFDWSQGNVFNEGSFSQGATDALTKAGVPQGFISEAEALIAEGRQARQEKYDSNITNVLGSVDNFKVLNDWVTANKNPQEIQSLQAMLNNSSTAQYALQGLKTEFEGSGGSFTPTQEAPPVNEPSPIPPSTGGGYTGMTPLRPQANPADAQEVAKAYASRDSAAIENVEQRVKLGLTQ